MTIEQPSFDKPMITPSHDDLAEPANTKYKNLEDLDKIVFLHVTRYGAREIT